MNKKRVFLFSILLIFSGFLLALIFGTHLIALASIVIAFFILIFSAILRGNKEQKGINEIKKLPFSAVSELTDLNDKTFVKVKGKLKVIDYTLSELTETKCIGYTYQEMKWTYTKRTGERRKKSQWKTIKSEEYTEDFYIEDTSGKIKVDTVGIQISSQFNQKKEKDGKITCVENLLLPDQKEYILIGTLNKENKKISIAKDFKKNKKDDFILIDPKSYDIIYNTSKTYRIGCAIFLIIIGTIFIAAITSDLWAYIIKKFL